MDYPGGPNVSMGVGMGSHKRKAGSSASGDLTMETGVRVRVTGCKKVSTKIHGFGDGGRGYKPKNADSL